MTLQAGYEPLLEAISDGDLRSLDRLLNTNRYSVNAEIGYNSEDNKPYIITPLYWAVKVGQREVCRFLLQRGADPYRHMVYEYYPLHEACNRGDEGIVQEFISAHCNLEHPNCDGDTPLHIASMRGHLECIRLLLNAGVDRTKQNVKGQTPLQAAQYTNQTDLYKLFEVFERGHSPIRWQLQNKSSLSSVSRHRPLSGGDYRRNSLTSTGAYSRQSSQLLHYSGYTNGTKDDTVICKSASRPRRSDVMRTCSFSGTDSRYQYSTLQDRPRPQYKSSLLQQHVVRPSLVNMSHDSQIILPTQPLISDPRRSQTYHDFSNVLPQAEITLDLTANDEVEVDKGTSQPGLGPKLRVSHIIQCLNQSISSGQDPLDSTHSRLLFSLHSELKFSNTEYNTLQQLTGDFCSSIDQRQNMPQSNIKETREMELVWGCDYEMVNCQPIHVLQGTPTTNYAQLVFRTRLLPPQSCYQEKENALLKVIINISDLREKDDTLTYHSDCYSNISQECQILSCLPPHPHIITVLHHCSAHSGPFERFLHLFSQDDISLKMSSRVSLLFLKDSHSDTLEKYLSTKKQMQALPPYGIDEKMALAILSQLLLALSHLDQYGIIIGYLTTADILIDTHQQHLYLFGFSHAFDVYNKEPSDVRNYLHGINPKTSLSFSPELAYLRDCSSTVIADTPPLRQYLRKSNAFTAARLFLEVFAEESLILESTDKFPELNCFSSNLKFLIKKLVSFTHHPENRPTAMQAAIASLMLLYGPSEENCRTLNDCQQWLLTESCHFFLQPSLKGYPVFYGKDIHTKLKFTYLTVVNPELLWSASQFVYDRKTNS